MSLFKSGLLALCLVSGVAMAEPAHQDSVSELMKVTHAQRLLDNMSAQYDHMMDMMIKESLQGKTPTPAQQKIIDRMKQRMVHVMREAMSWDKLQPIYAKIYQDSFSESDMRAMIDFYKSPAGKAVVEKMPNVLQRSMAAMQPMMHEMFPKMKQIGEDFAAEMAKAESPETSCPSAESAPAALSPKE